jgi:hypothetical protein
MYDPLQVAVVALGLAVALVAAVQVVLDRPIGTVLLGALALLEAGLLVQAVLGIGQVATQDTGVNALTFVLYLLGMLVLPPVAALWALGERSRAGTAVVIVLGVVTPVLVLRLEQVWSAAGGA